nr:uncharacterized protein LOC113704757 [Coffea arabica]
MRAEHIIWEVGNLMEFFREVQKLGRSFQGDGDCILARGRRRVGVCRQPMLVAWSRPPEQGLKLNTDASVTSLGVFGGGVVRSNEGRVIFAFYKEFGEVRVLNAEALALLSGLVYCQDRAITGVRAESDSAALVRMIASGAPASWPLCNVLRQIRFLLHELGGSLGHVYRQANMVADALASAQLTCDSVFNGEWELPRRVKALVTLDRLAIPHVRQ